MKIIIIAIATLIAGYLIGSFFPIRGFFQSTGPSIAGNSTLKVTVLRPDRSPATNLEVDIATKVGQVFEGGHEKTDANGIATFNIKPDTYYIFFNAINFPKDLKYTDTPSVVTQAGQTVSQTIILQPARK
jgi:hypothetical protein